MNKISAIIITKNEEHNIKHCLESILWADEIIIVDGGSSDNTLNIIENITNIANINTNIKTYIHTEWQGFGIQKNIALSYASYNYILSIDADEVVSDELKQNIQNICKNNTLNSLENSMYLVKRLNYFCGNPVKYSGWQNDKVVRVFNKIYAEFSNDKVHEKVILKSEFSPINQLISNLLCIDGILHHYSYTSFSQVLNKIEHYSSLGAEQLYIKRKKSSLTKAIIHGLTAFIKSFIFKLGFLDKSIGLNIALMNALASYYKYIKLKQMHITIKHKK